LERDRELSTLRAAIRAGSFRSTTSGLCPGVVQANLVILPQELAAEFRRFCRRNPRACPLIEETEPGEVSPRSAPAADLRSDTPLYRVYRRGQLEAELPDVTALWRPDLVSFLLGCSFTFERELAEAGIALRHQEQGTVVPMYVTRRPTETAGVFAGPLVVSMRPIAASRIAEMRAICARHPLAHGEPIQVGEPEALGIVDLARPDYGAPVSIREGELPVFWACGVTPQAVAREAKPELLITHAPGHMFLTDLRDPPLALPD
jgi:uncharacterized protein YcsI (UPF0317 family)